MEPRIVTDRRARAFYAPPKGRHPGACAAAAAQWTNLWISLWGKWRGCMQERVKAHRKPVCHAI